MRTCASAGYLSWEESLKVKRKREEKHFDLLRLSVYSVRDQRGMEPKSCAAVLALCSAETEPEDRAPTGHGEGLQQGETAGKEGRRLPPGPAAPAARAASPSSSGRPLGTRAALGAQF